MIIALGILSLLMSLLYINTNFNMFLFFFIISFICFVYGRKILFKIFSKPIIKRINRLKKKYDELIEQIDALEKDKNKVNISEINKYKQVINQLLIKEKELKKQIIILESKKESIETITNQEKIIVRAIEGEEKIFDILSKKNTILENQKLELQEEIEELRRKINPIKRRINFIEKCSINYIDNLDGYEFEKFCVELLQSIGYEKVENTKLSTDYGIDIVAQRDNIKYAIQCKRYEGKVGNDAIQEAIAGKEYYECNIAIVMTNSSFTKNAERLAKSTGVILWDRDFLYTSIERLKQYEIINKALT